MKGMVLWEIPASGRYGKYVAMRICGVTLVGWGGCQERVVKRVLCGRYRPTTLEVSSSGALRKVLREIKAAYTNKTANILHAGIRNAHSLSWTRGCIKGHQWWLCVRGMATSQTRSKLEKWKHTDWGSSRCPVYARDGLELMPRLSRRPSPKLRR